MNISVLYESSMMYDLDRLMIILYRIDACLAQKR